MARKRTAARRHEVRAELSVPSLTKAGTSLTLKVRSGRDKLGEITVGRGSLYWWGAHRRSRKRIPWSDFAALLDKLAYGK